jgi:phosphatidylinositol kinase/protein kinase (PI-3  family)
MMIDGHGDLPCWQGRPNDAAAEFRQRFQLQLNSDAAAGAFMNSLIDDSMNNWRTNWYDKYQRCCVGIF